MKENELVHGYPRSATELFSYHLLVWSDVNKELLTSKQFELTKEFVDQRGGSFLLFGGPEMLKRGNLVNTPIVSMLPVHLSQNTQVMDDDPYHVYPSAEGQISGVWSLHPDADANRTRWQDMPYLFGLSHFSLPHLGATALARAGIDGQHVPFYLLHRYGKGRSAILAADQTWPWQMQNREEDTAYSRLWRQMIRHLVDPVPSPIQIRGMKDAYIIDRPIPFEILIRDEHFTPMEGGSPKITIQSPAGKSSILPVEESLTEMGLYSCRFRPAENGLHTLSIKNGEESKISRAFLAVPDYAEFSNPQTNFARLKQIAQTSGGRYYPLAQLKNLANDLPWEPNETAKTLRLPFWHHPMFLFLLIALLSAEWYLRRRLGQP
ncbi:hypothetical protein GF373_16835 [bacterium]|nr:hypothetical protein [bacterium]